jgi:glutamine synthetase
MSLPEKIPAEKEGKFNIKNNSRREFMKKNLELCPNRLVTYLNKPSDEFTKADIIKFVRENGIKMLNFRYVGGDGRLKTLNFVINSLKHLDDILTYGERVDGSSLFKFIEAVSSDLYVIPRFKTAFVNPFETVPTLDILCAFYTSEGKPLEGSPSHIVKKAHETLREKTGYTMEAMGELEYYLFSEVDAIYPIVEQKGYHESHPFSKWGAIRQEAMKVISEMGCHIKYGHAEVGNIINEDTEMVQHEIEFLPIAIEDAADELVLAKWAIREIAYKYNLEVTFAPKIMIGQAGSGLHVHMRLLKDGKNAIAGKDGLTDVAKKLIAGMLDLAPSLTAFGNTVPTSYLRLVPHQEAPTRICWGERNRSVLVRIPLGWLGAEKLILDANPKEPVEKEVSDLNRQTMEIRNADGSANVHQLIAGLAVAAIHGFEMKNAVKFADKLHVSGKDASAMQDLNDLPASCWDSADELEKVRAVYEKDGIFPKGMISRIIKDLKSYEDKDLNKKIHGNYKILKKLISEYIHCG